jgi:hypothetical protein
VPHIAVWNDGDGVPLALVFAQEHGAGLEAPRVIGSRLAAPCEAIEMLCGLWIKPPKACSWMCQQMNRVMRSLEKAAALLALQAGLLTFVPTIGPFLAGIVIILVGSLTAP